MDPLLDVIRALHLTGGVFLDAEFSAPWCVSSQVDASCWRAFSGTPAHVIGYHYVIEGHCRLDVDGRDAVEVSAGEIVLLTRNDPHRLSSGPGLRPVSAGGLIRPSANGGLPRIAHGGGGARARFLCGFLGTDTVDPPIARVLPPVLVATVSEAATGAWIESSFRFAAQELLGGRPGSLAMASRLAELLFVEAAKRHLASLTAQHQGWLAGFRDPIVGRALALIHERREHPWTVPELAREAGASRSAFAERFTSMVGESPMRYLARQRLHQAADRLRGGDDSIATVGGDVGYESEAAFSRAFKREFGQSPAAWRKGEA